jgi:hypothetical protein
MRPKWILDGVLPIAPDFSDRAGEVIGFYSNASVPDYLIAHYWWAYIHES